MHKNISSTFVFVFYSVVATDSSCFTFDSIIFQFITRDQFFSVNHWNMPGSLSPLHFNSHCHSIFYECLTCKHHTFLTIHPALLFSSSLIINSIKLFCYINYWSCIPGSHWFFTQQSNFDTIYKTLNVLTSSEFAVPSWYHTFLKLLIHPNSSISPLVNLVPFISLDILYFLFPLKTFLPLSQYFGTSWLTISV